MLQLRNALDDRYHCQLPGPAGGKEGHDIKRRHGAEFITEEHDAIFQLSFIPVRNGKQFVGKVLDHKGGHEILRAVFLRQDQKDCTPLRCKGLRINGVVKAKHLLHLGIQKRIEPGQDRGHDGCHGLVRSVEGRARQPSGLVC
ncbi:Uncharacterised protein [uncultured Blautia sp.]|nr:Uncharacterised protein [uncultured Blautia sp.]